MHPIARLHMRLAASLFYPSAAASALAVALIIGRGLLSGRVVGSFLVWNLGLAWVPYLMALWAAAAAGRGPWRALLPGGLWLLFLPNAPYMLTDLIHLERLGFVWWYDLGTLLAFAWAGGLLGVASLYLMRGIVEERLGAAASWAFVLACCGLSGLGVYLGRFLRWNSWDVLTSPRGLAHELLGLLSDRAHYPQIVGVSGLFACFLALGFLTLDSARRV